MNAGTLAAFALCALSLGSAAHADSAWITPDEFAGMTEGRTWQVFSLNGDLLGTQRNLPDQGVQWKSGDGACVTGKWQVRNGSVCYAYPGVGNETCQRYFVQNDQLYSQEWMADGSGAKGVRWQMKEVSESRLKCP